MDRTPHSRPGAGGGAGLTGDAEMLMYLAALCVPGVVGGRVVVFLNRTGGTRPQVRQLDGRAANDGVICSRRGMCG